MYLTEGVIDAIVKIADDILWSLSTDDNEGGEPYNDGVSVPNGAVEYLDGESLGINRCPDEFESLHVKSVEECRDVIMFIIDSIVQDSTNGEYESLEDLYEEKSEFDISADYPEFYAFCKWVLGYANIGRVDYGAKYEFARAAIMNNCEYGPMREFDVPEEFHDFFDYGSSIEVPSFNPIGWVMYGNEFIEAYRDELDRVIDPE